MISASHTRYSTEIGRQTQLQQDINKLQGQVSTTKLNAAASDDPMAALQVSQIRRTQGNENAYAVNAETASTLATRVDSAFASVTTMLDRARELTVLAANDTYSPAQRKVVAAELRDLATSITTASMQTDPRGNDLFPAGTPTTFPIGDGIVASGTISRTAAFEGVATVAGPKSIAQILDEAATAAESGTVADRSASLTAVGAASDHVIAAHSLQGLDAARIDQAKEDLATNAVVLSDERSGVESTDLPAAIALIQAKLTTLNAAQAVFGKINKQTLFDVLG